MYGAEGDTMNACELTAPITVIVNWLANRLTQEQLALWGSSLMQLDANLLTIATQKSICCFPEDINSTTC